MSARQTTVGQLCADDLGKRVEGDGWAIERLDQVAHRRDDTGLWTRARKVVTRKPHDTPCTVTDPIPDEPTDPAHRHWDARGRKWARVDDTWTSPDMPSQNWADLLHQHGAWPVGP